jgi:putative membrane protein
MHMSPTPIAPYCGAPPSPADLAGRWNLDPVLLLGLVALLAAYLIGARRRPRAVNTPAFVAGWSIAVLALISPLCALSVSLFSARVAQHMVLALVAAPLIAFGRPAQAYAATLGLWQPAHDKCHALPAAIAFTIALWLWHAPGPYAATFASPAVYWLMHVSLFGTALWLWCEILNNPPSPAAVAASGLSMIQMGFLGALITLGANAVYAPHLLTTAGWGLTPLDDQQLGGAIMWAPGGLVFLAALTVVGWRALKPSLGRTSGGALAG